MSISTTQRSPDFGMSWVLVKLDCCSRTGSIPCGLGVPAKQATMALGISKKKLSLCLVVSGISGTCWMVFLWDCHRVDRPSPKRR
jgi:hypothetical protein